MVKFMNKVKKAPIKEKVLAIIPARGGSKGVKRKNIKQVGGKPLIAWVIESAQKTSCIDRLILSSEDEEIIRIAEGFGCEAPFVRPDTLARDDSPTIDVVIHALEILTDYEYVVLLQPTSPLTRPEDIDGCIRHCLDFGLKSCVSISEVKKSPFWMFTAGTEGNIEPLMGYAYLNRRRQELPKTYLPTGAIYVAQRKWIMEKKTFYFKETGGYIVPDRYSIDIDTETDFKKFENILESIKGDS
jgi:CMP-N,N'-diacetyllegionaminic acid synthase